MSETPNSIITPQHAFSRTALTTAANTVFTSNAVTITLLDRADNINGARVTRLFALPIANVATTANLQVYAANATTKYLIDSSLMTTVAPGASVANPKTDFGFSEINPLVLQAGWGIEVASGQAVQTVFRLEGGLY